MNYKTVKITIAKNSNNGKQLSFGSATANGTQGNHHIVLSLKNAMDIFSTKDTNVTAFEGSTLYQLAAQAAVKSPRLSNIQSLADLDQVLETANVELLENEVPKQLQTIPGCKMRVPVEDSYLIWSNDVYQNGTLIHHKGDFITDVIMNNGVPTQVPRRVNQIEVFVIPIGTDPEGHPIYAEGFDPETRKRSQYALTCVPVSAVNPADNGVASDTPEAPVGVTPGATPVGVTLQAPAAAIG